MVFLFYFKYELLIDFGYLFVFVDYMFVGNVDEVYVMLVV